jgi:NAD+ synthase (glutamine-hydrolysing)
VRELALKNSAAVAYVNLVGGQDDLVFDGDSLLVDAAGKLIGRAKQFESDLIFFDIDSNQDIQMIGEPRITKNDDREQVWNALVLGLRDYVNKNGFKSVVLGLSGGIDSAVCASIAADAIGADRVFGVSMPSIYSSEHSRSDADDSAERIGLHFRTEPIESMVDAFERQLGLDGVAAENLQARMRGVILMGLSNAEGHLTQLFTVTRLVALRRSRTLRKLWFGNWQSGATSTQSQMVKLPRFQRIQFPNRLLRNFAQTRPIKTACLSTNYLMHF